MFSSTNRDAEAKRVKDITLPLPYGFGMIINDEDLCKHYLYHLTVGNVGIFNNAPILHLHHDNLQLLSHLMYSSYHVNQCLCIVTDGEFEFPSDNWVQSGRRYGPIFSDQQLQFHCTRYRFKHFAKDERLILDLFTASAVPGAPDQAYNFNYRIMRIHNPEYIYSITDGLSWLRDSSISFSRAAIDLRISLLPPNYLGFILYDHQLVGTINLIFVT